MADTVHPHSLVNTFPGFLLVYLRVNERRVIHLRFTEFTCAKNTFDLIQMRQRLFNSYFYHHQPSLGFQR